MSQFETDEAYAWFGALMALCAGFAAFEVLRLLGAVSMPEPSIFLAVGWTAALVCALALAVAAIVVG